MSTTTLTLTDFLLARIAEDERAVERGDDYMPDGGWGRERVLAECAAKRRIVDRHSDCDDVSFGDASTCPDMRDLAAVYADHPDYRDEWRA